MACKSCRSDSQGEFGAEINIHIPKLTAPAVLVFPKIVVCLRCGFTEFTLVESELRALKQEV
jgi:hypothetical protein